MAKLIERTRAREEEQSFAIVSLAKKTISPFLSSSLSPSPLEKLTCQLLEDRDKHRDRRLCGVRPREQPPKPSGTGLNGALGRSDDLGHLDLGLLFSLAVAVSGAGALQHFEGVARVAAGVKGDGSVGKHRRGRQEQDRRDPGASQRQPPAKGEAEHRQVDQLRDQDADGGGELEEDVQGAADVRRGHLGEVEGDGLAFFVFFLERERASE